VLYGWLLDNDSHRCESLTDLSYPGVLLQGRKSSGDRFIESLRGDLYGEPQTEASHIRVLFATSSSASDLGNQVCEEAGGYLIRGNHLSSDGFRELHGYYFAGSE